MNLNLKNIKNDIIIGTAQLGTQYGIANKNVNYGLKERLYFLDEAYKNNYKTFDTAYAYKNSHKIIGKWIRSKKVYPKIYTKIPNLDKFVEEEINSIYTKSIKQLNISNLEGILLHNYLDWSKTDIKKFIIDKLEKKIIKNFGFSIYDHKNIPSDEAVNIIQVPGNIFNQSIIKSDEINNFLNKGGQVQVRSLFIQGLLLMNIDEIPYYLDEIKNPLHQFHNLAKELNTSSYELAILCVKNIIPQAKLVLGFDNINQLSILNSTNNRSINNSDLKEIINFAKKYNNKLWDPRHWH